MIFQERATATQDIVSSVNFIQKKKKKKKKETNFITEQTTIVIAFNLEK